MNLVCYNSSMKNLKTLGRKIPRMLRGFTLVELLVVIAIIILLTGIILTNLSPAKAKARDSKRISDLGQMTLAFELYFDRCKQYPELPGDLSTALPLSNYSQGCPSGSGISLATYLPQLLTPPSGTYDYAVNFSSGHNYDDYVLHTRLEYQSDVQKDSILNVNKPAYVGVPSNAAFSCYDSNDANAKYDYCIGPR